MNFLSHDVVLPPGSSRIMRVGATLPDLWVLLPRRPLPLTVVRNLRSHSDGEAKWLADGIEHHMRADAVFHRHPEFNRRVALAASNLVAIVGASRPAHVAAHVAVEMILDRWLIDRDSSLLDRYYESFDEESRAYAARLGVVGAASRDGLAMVLQRFAESGFLRDYVTADGIAMRLVRSLARTPFGLGEDCNLRTLAHWIDGCSTVFESGSAQLINDVRMGVEHWRDTRNKSTA